MVHGCPVWRSVVLFFLSDTCIFLGCCGYVCARANLSLGAYIYIYIYMPLTWLSSDQVRSKMLVWQLAVQYQQTNVLSRFRLCTLVSVSYIESPQDSEQRRKMFLLESSRLCCVQYRRSLEKLKSEGRLFFGSWHRRDLRSGKDAVHKSPPCRVGFLAAAGWNIDAVLPRWRHRGPPSAHVHAVQAGCVYYRCIQGSCGECWRYVLKSLTLNEGGSVAGHGLCLVVGMGSAQWLLQVPGPGGRQRGRWKSYLWSSVTDMEID